MSTEPDKSTSSADPGKASTAGIAHDLNNILTAIMGYTSLAAEELPEGHEARAHLDYVLGAAEHASQLTRQLLAYAGRGGPVAGPLQIPEIVREIARQLHASIPRNVAMYLSVPASLPPVEGDAAQIRQLITALVINAIESIGEQSSGVVSVNGGIERIDKPLESPLTGQIAAGLYVSLEVRGTGSGSPAQETRLAGMAAIAGAHRGALLVESASGQGAIVRILLPAAASAQQAHLEGIRETNLRGTGTVLVVDDEEMVRRTARGALERYGYDVVLAGGGIEGVEIFERDPRKIALVLLDLTMPILDGAEVARRMLDIRPDVPIIASSGYNQEEAMGRLKALQIAGFIQKPYTAMALAAKTKAALRRLTP